MALRIAHISGRKIKVFSYLVSSFTLITRSGNDPAKKEEKPRVENCTHSNKFVVLRSKHKITRYTKRIKSTLSIKPVIHDSSIHGFSLQNSFCSV